MSAVPVSGGWWVSRVDAYEATRWLAYSALAAMLVIAAAREFTLSHALAYLAFGGSVVGLLVAVTARPVLVAAGMVGLFALIDSINRIKIDYLEENIHVVDLFVLRDYATGGDFVLLWNYVSQFRAEIGLVATGSAAFVALAIWEQRRLAARPDRRRSPAAVLALAVAALVTGHQLWTGPRLATVAAFPFASQLNARIPLQPSYLLRTLVDFARMSEELGRDAPSRALAGATPCRDCPDLVIVHVESVFEPAMLAGRQNGPRLAEVLRGALHETSGFLRTNVFGGNSLISEFEVHCQVNHKLLGMAGLYPPLFMRPLVRRCAPDYLRDKGYETHIIYSVDPQYNYARATYRSYGLDHFYGPDDFRMPKSWLELRDGFLVDAALSILAKPRTRPRLVIVSTISNHGPHGEGLVREVFAGPFAAAPGDSAPLADYLNRLNDSIAQFRRLEVAITAGRVPTALLYYGDHQPAFEKTYAPEMLGHFGAATKFVTFWRMARGYGARPEAGEGPYHKLEDLVGHFLDFAGVALAPEQGEARAIVARCAGAQEHCQEAERRKLRSLFLR